ncbi:MAG: hypothetical protein AAFO69_03440 [Bacteroidota bacterium]
MYAGELENYITQADHEIDGYDNFQLPWAIIAQTAKDAQQKSKKERRRANRKKTLSDIEGKIKENGGIEGISQSLANVFGMFRKGSTTSNTPSNISVNLGSGNDDPDAGKVPTEYKILGGVAIALLAIWGISKLNGAKKVASTITQNNPVA